MAQPRCEARFALLLTLAASFCLVDNARGVPVVWTGPTITFTKMGVDTADPTDPANQDRLTDHVWLTRAATEGIFNIAPGQEDEYVRFTSPADTLWASGAMPENAGKTIAATNWQQLTFTTWAAAYGGPGMTIRC